MTVRRSVGPQRDTRNPVVESRGGFSFSLALRQFRTHLAAGLKSEETIASYCKAVDLAVAFWAGAGLPDDVGVVAREHVEMFLADLAGRVASATVVNRFKGLRAFFAWLVDEGEVSGSPMVRVAWPKLVEKPPAACSPDEIKAVLAVCGRDFRGRRDAALISVFLDSGWRVSEILALTRADVEAGGRLAAPAKGGKTVVATLSPVVRQAVDRYLRVLNSERPELWMSDWGRPMTRNAVWEVLARRSEQAGVQHINPHMLRHSHAMWWLKAGGSVVDLKENLGHSSVRVTERYLRYQAQDRADEARKRFGPGNLLGDVKKPSR